MRVLYYLEPRPECGDPLFHYGTLRNTVLPQLDALRRDGVDARLLFGEALHDAAVADHWSGHLGARYTISPEALAAVASTDEAVRALRFGGGEEGRSSRRAMADLVRGRLPDDFAPDVVMAWETPAPYLAEAFPEALVVQQYPGLFSRPPFPELVAFDTGLLSRSVARAVVEEARREVASHTPAVGLEALRARDEPLLRRRWPLPGLLRAWKTGFDRLLLVPLQLDEHFTVTETLPAGMSQLGWLTEILERTPGHVGVVVTQYRSQSAATELLDDTRLADLRVRFPHLLYDDRLEDVPWVSQFLVPEVDGVACISSSVGAQGAYWKKPVWCADGSPYGPLASADTLDSLLSQIEGAERPDRDPQLLAVLARMHVPMNRITDEPRFLRSWIDALREAHRAGELAEGRWPLHEPPASFAERLVATRRSRGLSLGLRRLGWEAPLEDEPFWADFEAALSEVDAVSFDVFDTLLVRTTTRPTAVFESMGHRAGELLGIDPAAFVDIRRRAEAKAVADARARGGEDGTLEAIYDAIGTETGAEPTAVSALMRAELDAERRFLVPRPAGLAAYRMARSMGLRTPLLSDMYLPPAFVAERLEAVGVDTRDGLHVSSEIQRKKDSGTIFPWVQERLGVPPRRILHVGDNPIGDLEMPRAAGWRALLLRRPMQELGRTEMHQRIWGPLGLHDTEQWRTLLAVMAHELYDDPARVADPTAWFEGDPYRLGVAAFGPVLLGFAAWVAQVARERGYERLYFLARDGLVMKRAYDLVVADDPDAPPSRYLLCSRRAVGVACLHGIDDVERLLRPDFEPVALGRLLDWRFGLTEEDVDAEALERADLRWTTEVTMEDRPRILTLLGAIEATVLGTAKREREAYLAYLEQEGFLDGAPTAVVDIGYVGTMQRALTRLRGDSGPVAGLYLMTYASATDAGGALPMHGYLGEGLDPRAGAHPIAHHVPVIETLFSGPDPSFVCMRHEAGALVPEYREPLPTDALRVQVVSEAQQGALRLVQAVGKATGAPLGAWSIDARNAMATLDAFVQAPTAEDAAILSGIRFEDAYGGQEGRWLVPDLEHLETDSCKWTAGKQSLLAARRRSPARRALFEVSAAAARFLCVPLVDLAATMTLSQRKQWKLRHNPDAFFGESRHEAVRRLGRVYLLGQRSGATQRGRLHGAELASP